MATESLPIAGLDDLLKNALSFEDPERAASAAGNVLTPVLAGIEAIGDLLWHSSHGESFESLDRKTVGDIGCLLKFLADTAGSMVWVAGNAQHQLVERPDQVRLG